MLELARGAPAVAAQDPVDPHGSSPFGCRSSKRQGALTVGGTQRSLIGGITLVGRSGPPTLGPCLSRARVPSGPGDLGAVSLLRLRRKPEPDGFEARLGSASY